jgi:hypothetical protein
MRKSYMFGIGIILLSWLGVSPAATASSSYPGVTLTPSVSSTTADGKSSIAFTVTYYLYECQQPYVFPEGGAASYVKVATADQCHAYGNPAQDLGSGTLTAMSGNFGVKVSGNGNTIEPGDQFFLANGTATFSIKSTAAETKTVTLWTGRPGILGALADTTTVTFTAPAPAHLAPKSTPPAPAQPGVPLLETVTIDDTSANPKANNISLTQGKSLIIAGKALANATVTLYIYSDPRTATVTADKNGGWSYTVNNLPAGTHRIEAEVTDPTTSKTSDRAQLLNFTVTAATSPKIQSSSTVWWPIVAGVTAAVLAVGVALFVALRAYKRRQLSEHNSGRRT